MGVKISTDDDDVRRMARRGWGTIDHMDEWLKAIERDRAIQANVALDENEDLRAELEQLRAQVADLTANYATLSAMYEALEDRAIGYETERDDLRAQITEFGKSPAGIRYRMAVDILSGEFEQALAIVSDERDDLAARLTAATWQPGPEVWASVPVDMLWITGRHDGLLDAFEDEPSLFPEQWWSRAGNVWHVGAELPLGVDWRLAKWRRPES